MATHDEDKDHPVTKGDLRETKDDLRRDMKLYLIVGVSSGNVIAAFVAAYFRDSKPVQTALHAVSALLS